MLAPQEASLLPAPAGSQGVVKALREQGLLPRVIAGSSVGSIGARAPLLPRRMPCSSTIILVALCPTKAQKSRVACYARGGPQKHMPGW